MRTYSRDRHAQDRVRPRYRSRAAQSFSERSRPCFGGDFFRHFCQGGTRIGYFGSAVGRVGFSAGWHLMMRSETNHDSARARHKNEIPDGQNACQVCSLPSNRGTSGIHRGGHDDWRRFWRPRRTFARCGRSRHRKRAGCFTRFFRIPGRSGPSTRSNRQVCSMIGDLSF